MGRNSIPKLGEWRDGYKYYFEAVNSFKPNETKISPNSGDLIVYKRDHTDDGKFISTEVLATCNADGFEECLAQFWNDGYNKGIREGRKQKTKEINAVLREEK